MADDDRERWNARYRERTGPGEPAAAVTELGPWLPGRGRALDLAGGAGAHALWLAARGLEVTLVDVSEAALALAVQATVLRGVDLRVAQLDLERDPLPAGPWDLVLCSFYLQRDLPGRVAEVLAPGGRFVWVHPTAANLERHAKPSARFLLQPGEAQALASAAGLEPRWSEEAWVGEGEHARHLARLVAEAPR